MLTAIPYVDADCLRMNGIGTEERANGAQDCNNSRKGTVHSTHLDFSFRLKEDRLRLMREVREWDNVVQRLERGAAPRNDSNSIVN